MAAPPRVSAQHPQRASGPPRPAPSRPHIPKPASPAAIAAHPAPAATPAPAPAATPAPTPFLTPEQQQTLDAHISAMNGQIIDLNTSLSETVAKTVAQAGNLVNGHLDNTGSIYHLMQQHEANANDALIARGLFQSSIRDGDLSDIESKAALQRNAMYTTLGLQQASTQSREANLTSAMAAYQASAQSQAYQNAQGVPVSPDAAQAPAPAPAQPAAPKPPVAVAQHPQALSGSGITPGIPSVSSQHPQQSSGY